MLIELHNKNILTDNIMNLINKYCINALVMVEVIEHMQLNDAINILPDVIFKDNV
jgi:hypothetical protein